MPNFRGVLRGIRFAVPGVSMRRLVRVFLTAAAVLLPAVLFCRKCGAPSGVSRSDLPAFYRIYRTETGTVENVPVRDYLIGTVGAEMPASYLPEALKAQTVAAHSYAEYVRRQRIQHPEPSLHGAALSDDCARDQAFIPPEQLRRTLGEHGYAAIAAAVDAAGDMLLLYDNAPAAAVYHACSAGRTESAAVLWGNAVPYLVQVDSPADRNAPQYAGTVTLSADELRERLTGEGIVLPDDPAAWLSVQETSESGTVLRARCGSAELTGMRLRNLLGLRSACFTFTFADGIFTFRTRGFGHGAGMSQYGANALAAQGCDAAEILQYYYPGTALTAQKPG